MPNIKLVLSAEQELFIKEALLGKNILVDACIGSGKTTAIQELCNKIPQDKRVLYLTYNKLLKIDAQKRIQCKNVTVTNYHGYAYMVLTKLGVRTGISDLIQTYISRAPEIEGYDVLILDEYQDIEQELADMLELIKSAKKGIQIIAVGDMQQKIYDKTTLYVEGFIEQFLGEHEKLEFTKCFRLSKELAAGLGRIWEKPIDGVNENCHVEEMTVKAVTEFLSRQHPKDVLCLGSRTSKMTEVLNTLEKDFPESFNKNTVYASIKDSDGGGGASVPKKDSAIFTTYDSSKGLERPVCVIFDYTQDYWGIRVRKPQQSYEILRNIFCVAASRGKNHIIFVNDGSLMLSEKTLSTAVYEQKEIGNVGISEMFDFKYKENIEACFSLLKTERIPMQDQSMIEIKNTDGLIDLSPCIGIYQEASFFSGYDIDEDIKHHLSLHDEQKILYTEKIKKSSVEEKVLFLTSLETKQQRYRRQVAVPFVAVGEKRELTKRLESVFSHDEIVQVKCKIPFIDGSGKKAFTASGLCDVFKDNIVYELKFVYELTHEHYLQCACYVAALNLEKGILWNTRNNEMYSITIPDKEAFLEEVAKAVTKNTFKSKKRKKRRVSKRKADIDIPAKISGDTEMHIGRKDDTDIAMLQEDEEEMEAADTIAVIDTETNWDNQVMSIGLVLADCETYKPIRAQYYILEKEAAVGGMYSHALLIKGAEEKKLCSREEAMAEIDQILRGESVSQIFAYNAAFDKTHLPELSDYAWYDIMRIAAYRQHNTKIPKTSEFCATGRLKRNYGVEPIMRILSENKRYLETHNAILDAKDELKIMELLGLDLDVYVKACIKGSSKKKA